MIKEQPSWADVIRHLKTMLDLVDKTSEELVNIRNVAPVFASLGKSYNEVIIQYGLSSMRARAAAKALDLSTKKSKLESFLEEEDV